jgi:hypothetical protein
MYIYQDYLARLGDAVPMGNNRQAPAQDGSGPGVPAPGAAR